MMTHDGSRNTPGCIRAVIFDLDGTLLDTIEDIADSMNAVLLEMGLPTHPCEEYKHLVGDGVGALTERVLPPDMQDAETVSRYVSRMKDEYSRRWALKTRPYEGIEDMLAGLDRKGLRLNVLSNKIDSFTKQAVDFFLGDRLFEIVLGAGGDWPRKPDPAAALHIAAGNGIPPREFLFVGDTNTDMKTASAAGMYPVGVLWGFRDRGELEDSGARIVIEHPRDLVTLVENY